MAVTEKEFYEMKADVATQGKDIVDLKSRVGDVERKQETLYDMSKNIALMAQSLKQVEGDVGEVKKNQKDFADELSELRNAPAQETLTNIKKIKIAAISAIVSGAAVVLAGVVFTILAK